MTERTTRQRLLDAAAVVARRDGASAITLETVASEAGLSKGGLLYHFTTKDALIDALIEDWLDRFEADMVALSGELGWARAYARVAAQSHRRSVESATDVAILVAVAGDPRRLEIIGRRYSEWQERLAASASDPVDATVARLAADGLWFADLLGLARPSGQLREDVLARMEDLSGD